MATTTPIVTLLPEPSSAIEAWNESARQSILTHGLLGQVECGLTTHAGGDCRYCGARV